MQGLSDYEIPQKVAQNDGLDLLLKMVCRTSHKNSCRSEKIRYMPKKTVFLPSVATDAPFTGAPLPTQHITSTGRPPTAKLTTMALRVRQPYPRHRPARNSSPFSATGSCDDTPNLSPLPFLRRVISPRSRRITVFAPQGRRRRAAAVREHQGKEIKCRHALAPATRWPPRQAAAQ